MTRQPWTPLQLDALHQLYPDHEADIVGRVIDRDRASVYRKAAQLGIHKSEAFKAAYLLRQSERARLDPRLIKGQFQPGHESWNKGKPSPTRGRSGDTQFKPGNKPHTTLPVGSYRINSDGHLQRKVSESSGCNSKRWRGVAELVWVDANGPVPPKHIVVFKPGQRTAVLEQITLDRVECISMAENARRNHPNNKSPELAKLVQLKGAITRQVNRIARTAKEQTHEQHA